MGREVGREARKREGEVGERLGRSSLSKRSTGTHVRRWEMTSARRYSTIHPEHKPIVHLPTKEEETVEKEEKPERAINLVGLTRQELQDEFVHFGIEKYRATQVFQWLYAQGAQSFEDMPTIGKKTIEKLKQHYFIEWGATSADSTSNDGTRKWLVDLGNKQCVESTFFKSSRSFRFILLLYPWIAINCTLQSNICKSLYRKARLNEISSNFPSIINQR